MSRQIRQEIESELSSFKEKLDEIRNVNKTITDAGDIVESSSELLDKNSRQIEEVFKNAERQLSEISSSLQKLEKLSDSFETLHSDFEKANVPRTLEKLEQNLTKFSDEFKEKVGALLEHSEKIAELQQKFQHRLDVTDKSIKESSENVNSKLQELTDSVKSNESLLNDVLQVVKKRSDNLNNELGRVQTEMNQGMATIEDRVFELAEELSYHEEINRKQFIYLYVFGGVIILLQVSYFVI